MDIIVRSDNRHCKEVVHLNIDRSMWTTRCAYGRGRSDVPIPCAFVDRSVRDALWKLEDAAYGQMPHAIIGGVKCVVGLIFCFYKKDMATIQLIPYCYHIDRNKMFFALWNYLTGNNDAMGDRTYPCYEIPNEREDREIY